jgi:ABC-2 type transport system ATP-binding protein
MSSPTACRLHTDKRPHPPGELRSEVHHMSSTWRTNGDRAIVASQLVKVFDEVAAVDGVDLEVGRGEIYGFLGPNGAGKSTTVRMLCTLSTPTSGSGQVLGHDIVRDALAVRLRIG